MLKAQGTAESAQCRALFTECAASAECIGLVVLNKAWADKAA
jgi:hypothetical protein